MPKERYRQCDLERSESSNSTLRTTSWIPEKFAVVGKVLKLKDDNGVWTTGWVVKQAGDESLDEDDLECDVQNEIRERIQMLSQPTKKRRNRDSDYE